MELEQITVKQFKKVSGVTLNLADLNILVGANSSGKSSILQAIHLASCLMRQTKKPVKAKTTTVSVNELDYLPTNDYKKLGHEYDWKTQPPANPSAVSFSFNDNGNKVKSWIRMKQARNTGISVEGNFGNANATSIFRPKNSTFSAYVSGVSGISNEEQKQSKRVVLKACSFGDGNAYLRNALDLLEDDEIAKIEGWLSALIGKIKITVKHDEDKDLTIDATARLGTDYRDIPLELLGAGYIQLIQIFCYLFLFKPKILLIDEPDIHLHPNVQEKLPKVLLGVARERNIKIILATHSPFIVRGAPINAKTYWMEDGIVKDSNREAVELALGWGAFGKKIILISEDTDTKLLRHILAQWSDIEGQVAIMPGTGYSNLPTPEKAKQLKNALGGNFKIVIHRDRDSMSASEMNMLSEIYEQEDVNLWITDLSNIESYFCVWEFVKALDNLPPDFTKEKLNEIIELYNSTTDQKFVSQRIAHNKEFHSAGGSPPKEEIWEELQSRQLKAAPGKKVFEKIQSELKNWRFSKEVVLEKSLDGNVATSLKEFLEALL